MNLAQAAKREILDMNGLLMKADFVKRVITRLLKLLILKLILKLKRVNSRYQQVLMLPI
jgi:hypothetical protein